ncbi:hypothetical protein PTKIN_Ptkin02bG0008700 [Pterospermum kingtungense]
MSSNDSNPPPSSEQPPEKKQKTEGDNISVRNWKPLLESDEDEIIVHHSTDSTSDDEEDMEEYEAAVKASDGFDVPDPTRTSFCGRIVPMTPLDDYSREMLSSLSSGALEHYNELHFGVWIILLSGCHGLLCKMPNQGELLTAVIVDGTLHLPFGKQSFRLFHIIQLISGH